MLPNKTEQTKEKLREKGHALVTLIYVAFLALAITSLMVLYIDRLPSNIVEGKIAMQDIRADQNYEIVDEDATGLLREDASLKSPPVYVFDVNVAADITTQIQDAFEAARGVLIPEVTATASAPLSEAALGALKQNLFIKLGAVLGESEFKKALKEGFSAELETAVVALLDVVHKKPIVQDKSLAVAQQGLGLVLRKFDADKSEYDEDSIATAAGFLSLEDAKNIFKGENVTSIKKLTGLDGVGDETIKTALAMVPYLTRVTVVFDKDETDKRRERAMFNVQEIIHKLQKGQTIFRRGDRIEKRHVTILNGIRAQQLQTNLILKFLGVFILVTATLVGVFVFARTAVKSFNPTRKDLNFLGITLILFLVILRVCGFMSATLQDAVPFSVEIATFYYLIPIAAGAMIVRLILNQVTTFVFLVVSSLFCGLFLENNFQLTAYYFLSSVFGAYLVGGVEKRSSVVSRGFYLGLGNVVLVFSLGLINTISVSATVDWEGLWVNLIFAFSGGMAAAFTILAMSPVLEALFNYTTNIQLLELANMNHPLLREMIVRSPGTYLHSQLVGTLAEAATRAINGNALLARVGSYYHDIGKMKKPQYFVENQKGENPHDKLAPSMSALIIDNHVKDGLEMAAEYKLPKVIADFIPEHQGTKLIGFFYHKAKKEAGDEADKIDERDYRYVGPKPQSREAGIVMLADTVEAAVRSMPDKAPQKMRTQVEKLVNMHFVDGQLDECELTLRDLHLIVDAFVSIFMGIYHHRVEYPEEASKNHAASKEFTKIAADSNRQQASQYATVSPLFKEKR